MNININWNNEPDDTSIIVVITGLKDITSKGLIDWIDENDSAVDIDLAEIFGNSYIIVRFLAYYNDDHRWESERALINNLITHFV